MREQTAGQPVVLMETLNADSTPTSVEAARTLLLEYGQFVLAAEGPARFCFGKLEEEANGLPASYAAQGGQLLLAWIDNGEADVVAGCVTFRALVAIPGACEMKRLWVRPRFRGSGLGERLILELFDRAQAAGFSEVCLDTVPATMGPAYRMYQRLGFVACPPFHQSATSGMVFMKRRLA